MARTRLFYLQKYLKNKHASSPKKVLHIIVTHAYFVEHVSDISGGNTGNVDYCAITALAHQG